MQWYFKKQAINLQSPGCLYKVGTVIHEIMHCLGFFHEQNRSDRDDYVRINWNNVRQGQWKFRADRAQLREITILVSNALMSCIGSNFIGMNVNFDKASSYITTAYGVGYDYGSVMHYSQNAFSRNGQPTISAKVGTLYFVSLQHNNTHRTHKTHT